MSDTLKHTKITTYTPQEDGTIKAVTESYFDDLASRSQDVIGKIKTDRNNFLSDLVSSAEVIMKQQAKVLTLTITVDEWNQPCLIVKQYTIRKENFNRR